MVITICSSFIFLSRRHHSILCSAEWLHVTKFYFLEFNPYEDGHRINQRDVRSDFISDTYETITFVTHKSSHHKISHSRPGIYFLLCFFALAFLLTTSGLSLYHSSQPGTFSGASHFWLSSLYTSPRAQPSSRGCTPLRHT